MPIATELSWRTCLPLIAIAGLATPRTGPMHVDMHGTKEKQASRQEEKGMEMMPQPRNTHKTHTLSGTDLVLAAGYFVSYCYWEQT